MTLAYFRPAREFAEANPTVGEWYRNLRAKKAESTSQNYLSQLKIYWDGALSAKHRDIGSWLDEVRVQVRDPDARILHTWARDLENWYLSKKMASGTRHLLMSAVRSYLSFFVALPKYDFIFATKDEVIAEAREREKLVVLKPAEIKRLVDEANTTYKAVILTQVSGGLGVSELIEFSKTWFNYEGAIRAKSVPTRIDMIRPKTAVAYHTYLWDDAIDSLNALLLERERKLNRKLAADDLLFAGQYKKPITAGDIQTAVRLLADRTGLDPKVPGRRVYRVRPHEFRDYFRTMCKNSRTDNDVAEFALGHQIDPLRYQRFQETDEGQEMIRMELAKARHRLNVVTGRGDIAKSGTSYFETTLELLSVTKTVAYDEVKAKLVVYAKRLPAYEEKRVEMSKDGRQPEPLDVLRNLTREQLFPAVTALVKAMTEGERPAAAQPYEYKSVPAEKVNEFIEAGWEPFSPVNTTSYMVRRPKQ